MSAVRPSVDGVLDYLFLVLLALISTVIGYRFGMGNQEEHIPMILRQLDAGYLTSDFFVSSSVEFGPRLYYARFVALLAEMTSLPWAYGTLRFVSDLALGTVTWWAAVRVIGAPRSGAMIAALLTLTVSSFHLGDATELRYEMFQPATLAIPGMLLAIGLGFCGRPMSLALVASATSLIHPLYGLYGGALGLCTAFAALGWRRAIVPGAVACGIFGGTLLLFWWWPSVTQHDRLTTEELFAIFGRFRSPHHYYPSEFRPGDYVATALFVFAGSLAFRRWSLEVPHSQSRLILVVLFLVCAGCVVGTLFIEVWPVRAVLTLQAFRLLSVLKWIGYLLIGWLLARYWERPPVREARPIVALCLLSPAGSFPPVTAAGLSALRWHGWLAGRDHPAVFVAAFGLAAAILWSQVEAVYEWVRMLVALGLVALFIQPVLRVRMLGAALAVLFVAAVLTNRPSEASEGPAPLRPVLGVGDLRGPAAETARAAGALTPPDALFLAPPDFGILRIVGPRALVTDFEGISYQDAHMREWRDRIRRVYGEAESTGHGARVALGENWRGVTDVRLRELARRYGATHAVLYAETATAMPELYANQHYRIVLLGTR